MKNEHEQQSTHGHRDSFGYLSTRILLVEDSNNHVELSIISQRDWSRSSSFLHSYLLLSDVRRQTASLIANEAMCAMHRTSPADFTSHAALTRMRCFQIPASLIGSSDASLLRFLCVLCPERSRMMLSRECQRDVLRI